MTAHELREWLHEQEGELMRPVKLSGYKPTDYILKRQSVIQALRRLVDDVEGWMDLERHLGPRDASHRILQEIRDYRYGGKEADDE